MMFILGSLEPQWSSWWRCCLGHSKTFSDDDDDDWKCVVDFLLVLIDLFS